MLDAPCPAVSTLVLQILVGVDPARPLPCLQVEDRPVVKERVENILEHRPVEKEFVVRKSWVVTTVLPNGLEQVAVC